MIVSILSSLISEFNIDKSIEIINRSLGIVLYHIKSVIAPKQTTKIKIERRVGSSLNPHGVKLRMNPISETTAIDKPKLRVILSVLHIFLIGIKAYIIR